MLAPTTKMTVGILAGICLCQQASAFSPILSNGVKGLRQTPFAAGLPHSGLRQQVQATNHGLLPRIRKASIQMIGGGDQNEVPALERFVACLPYALPLSDTFEWGHYLFDKFPIMALPFIPLFPVIRLLNMPFVSFGVFIVLFSFVTRNPSFSRFVRYNTLQILKSFNIGGPPPVELAEVGSNTVFYAIMLSIVYAAITNASGRIPNDIPIISESVDSQLPF